MVFLRKKIVSILAHVQILANVIQKSPRQLLCVSSVIFSDSSKIDKLVFCTDLLTKNSNEIFFHFLMILCRIMKGVYLSLFEHANTRKHVYEHSCSSVRVFLSILILAHLAHLAQSFFLISNAINEQIY